MALTLINKRLPFYTALATDISANKIAGLTTVGARVFLTDSQIWKIVLPDLTLANYKEGVALSDIPVKATGAEINTGTNDTKFVTPLAVADSNIAFISDIPVKAIGSEINTGSNDDKFVTPLAIANSTLKKNQVIFTVAGALSVTTGKLRIYNNYGSTMTITNVMMSVDTAPTGANLTIDIHKNGTTIFTDQAHRPAILAGTNMIDAGTIDVPAWAVGEYLTMDVDIVGSTVTGSDLTVHVVFTK